MPLPVLALLALAKGAAVHTAGAHIASGVATHLAHAPATAFANFLHDAGTNVLVAAGSAGGAAAATHVLYEGGSAGHKLYKKINEITTPQEQLVAVITNEMRTEAEIYELLGTVASYKLAERYYSRYVVFLLRSTVAEYTRVTRTAKRESKKPPFVFYGAMQVGRLSGLCYRSV